MAISIASMDENAAKQAAQLFQSHYYEQRLRAEKAALEIERLRQVIRAIRADLKSDLMPDYCSWNVEALQEWVRKYDTETEKMIRGE